MREAELAPMGVSLATGRPCFVITIPSGLTRSSSDRHWALKRPAGIVCMLPRYDRSQYVSIFDAASREVAHHMNLGEGRCVPDWAGAARSMEAAVLIKRDRRCVGSSDPQGEL